MMTSQNKANNIYATHKNLMNIHKKNNSLETQHDDDEVLFFCYNKCKNNCLILWW